jgi:hypothetical protein
MLWHLYKDKIIYSSAFTLAFGVAIFFLNKICYPTHFWDHFPYHPGVDQWFSRIHRYAQIGASAYQYLYQCMVFGE